jgi:uncharacterized membrane protein
MRRRERAQVIVWVAIMVPLLFLPILGLTMDAGVLFDARRSMQNLADGAARVGAMEIDQNDLRSNPTGAPHLDPAAARRSAAEYLDRSGFRSSETVIQADRNHIVVTVTKHVRPTFLSLLRVPEQTIRTTGQASPCAGVTDARFSCTT